MIQATFSRMMSFLLGFKISEMETLAPKCGLRFPFISYFSGIWKMATSMQSGIDCILSSGCFSQIKGEIIFTVPIDVIYSSSGESLVKEIPNETMLKNANGFISFAKRIFKAPISIGSSGTGNLTHPWTTIPNKSSGKLPKLKFFEKPFHRLYFNNLIHVFHAATYGMGGT